MTLVPSGNTTCPSERNSKTRSFQVPAREVPCMSEAILLRLAPGRGVRKRCPPDGMLRARGQSRVSSPRSAGGNLESFPAAVRSGLGGGGHVPSLRCREAPRGARVAEREENGPYRFKVPGRRGPG